MAKKTDVATAVKLNRLKAAMGTVEKVESQKSSKKQKAPTFKTGEVVALLLITIVIGLLMGGTVAYKIADSNKGEKVDEKLQNFLNNYEYIIDNYNGEVDKEELLDAALEGMLSKLDTNSTYLDSNNSKNFNIFLEGSYQGIGIEIYNDENMNIVIYRVIDNSPAAKAGLKAGDIITKLNSKDVKGLKTSEFVKKAADNKEKEMQLTYIREEKENTVKLNMEKVNIKSVSSEAMDNQGKKTGYIGVGIFASNTYKQFKKAVESLEKENIDSLIIDLRSNSGGYLTAAEEMISLFLDSSHVIYQVKKDNKTTKYYSQGDETKKYKIVVLVDGSSASASEIMASALKEQYGATIVGKKTYGKGSVQEMQTLTNGDKFKLTTKNWITSKGQWVDGEGLMPDIEVELDKKYFEDPSDNNDSQLQKALEECRK